MNSLMTPLSDWDAGVLERLPTPLRRVESDSRRVLPGDVFLAFRGEYADGRDYIASALARGAAAVLWAAAGLDVSQGVAISIAYGMVVLTSTLPGAWVLMRRGT